MSKFCSFGAAWSEIWRGNEFLRRGQYSPNFQSGNFQARIVFPNPLRRGLEYGLGHLYIVCTWLWSPSIVRTTPASWDTGKGEDWLHITPISRFPYTWGLKMNWIIWVVCTLLHWLLFGWTAPFLVFVIFWYMAFIPRPKKSLFICNILVHYCVKYFLWMTSTPPPSLFSNAMSKIRIYFCTPSGKACRNFDVWAHVSTKGELVIVSYHTGWVKKFCHISIFCKIWQGSTLRSSQKWPVRTYWLRWKLGNLQINVK